MCINVYIYVHHCLRRIVLSFLYFLFSRWYALLYLLAIKLGSNCDSYFSLHSRSTNVASSPLPLAPDYQTLLTRCKHIRPTYKHTQACVHTCAHANTQMHTHPRACDHHTHVRARTQRDRDPCTKVNLDIIARARTHALKLFLSIYIHMYIFLSCSRPDSRSL